MMWKTDEVPSVYLMALCAWREARGCADAAISGVLHVINNRSTRPSWWGHSIVEVVLKAEQFSSFNSNDPNATKFPQDGDQVFGRILHLTDAVLNRQNEDLTGGATHYHSLPTPPAWAASMTKTAQIGPFTFYKESQ